LSKPEFIPTARWVRPKQALQVLPFGLTKLYELLNSGRIRSKRVDGMRLVDLESCQSLGEQVAPKQTPQSAQAPLKRWPERHARSGFEPPPESA
jgi:hypothetical protein